MLRPNLFHRREILGAALGTVTSRTPFAFADSHQLGVAGSSSGRMLVVIQLDGGNDGINTVVPYADEAYSRNRRELKIETDRLIKIDDEIGLHPSMRAIGDLIEQGRLAIIQGVGYPNPSRSHFQSMRIWHTGQIDASEESEGWLGRALDTISEQQRGSAYVGDEKLPLALSARGSLAAAVSPNDPLRLESSINPRVRLGNRESDQIESSVARITMSAFAALEKLSKRQHGPSTGVAYPGTSLGGRLKLISELIKSDVHSRVYYTIQKGYDTHSVQLPRHAALLRELAESLKVFVGDLASSGLLDRVDILAFSEFGRRVEENASFGTDHGTAGPVFVAGNGISAGLLGVYPQLDDLQDGDLKPSMDFRGVYATLLQRLGFDGSIWLDRFENIPIFNNNV